MKNIELKHGGGGKASRDLLELFLKYFNNDILSDLEDASVINLNDNISNMMAYTTDSFVIKPVFFPGGDIGRLSVCGTSNDLVSRGAKPEYISSAFIIEEGYPLEDLERIISSMSKTASEAGVKIITGDTKVVEKGKADGVFINTSGIGYVVIPGVSVLNTKPGDSIIITGTIGDHGITIMSQREGIDVDLEIQSDCAPLNKIIDLLKPYTGYIHTMRDPTRGGLAAVLNEIANSSRVDIEINESELPVKDAVKSTCEILGLDLLTLANEGKLIITVDNSKAYEVLEILKSNSFSDANIIGYVRQGDGIVSLKTIYGTDRIIDVPVGELLPRIC